jgi:hypothetical protein
MDGGDCFVLGRFAPPLPESASTQGQAADIGEWAEACSPHYLIV